MSKYIIDKKTLTEIGDNVRYKINSQENIAVVDLPTAINSINTAKKEPINLELTGNDFRYLSDENYSKISGLLLIANNHPEKIVTSNITNLYKAFTNQVYLTSLDFHINTDETLTNLNVEGMFSGCSNLRIFPTINYHQKLDTFAMFSQCHYLTTEQLEKYIGISSNTFIQDATISGCYSLKHIPQELFGSNVTESGWWQQSFCRNCYALDYLKDIYYPYKYKTENIPSNAFSYGCRISDIIFRTNGIPLETTSEKIYLYDYVGYCPDNSYILDWNSGITADKEVYDDASYQALKNDPDWFTCDVRYSRYNHDSAVRTINSLPDLSAYKKKSGGTNTITFKAISGAKTDGGPISALTAEEKAVATSRGWTLNIL